MENTTCKQLRKAWKLTRNEYCCGHKKFYSYVSAADEKAFKDDQELFFYYQTHILPQPFFGKIENPKIVILALNPKYLPLESESEIKKVFKLTKDKKYISDNELSTYINNTNKIFEEDECTKQWWKNNVFDGLEYSDIDVILDNVAIFNLCGYHSLNYQSIPRNVLERELPTQTALKEHLAFVLSQENVQIIKIWGVEWKDFLEQIKQQIKNDPVKSKNFEDNVNNMLVVNEKNPRNKKIINAPKCSSKIKEMFKNFKKK